MVVKSDAEFESTHFLLEIVKDDKLTIDSAIFSDQVKEGNTDKAQS